MDHSKLLPFSTFSTRSPKDSFGSHGWEFDIPENRLNGVKFFGLFFLRDTASNLTQVGEEMEARIKDSVLYQANQLQSNNVSITMEDFFEQALQRINNELSLYVKDYPAALSVHQWSLVIGMITPGPNEKTSNLFISRYGDLSGWLLHDAQLETKNMLAIFDVSDTATSFSYGQKLFKYVLSSTISSQDQLFFCSPNLLNYLSLSELKRILSTLHIQGAMRHLQNLVEERNEIGSVCALSIKLSTTNYKAKSEMEGTKDSAKHSMETLIHTQSETEKLLTTSVNVNIKNALQDSLNSLSSLMRKTKKLSQNIPVKRIKRKLGISPTKQAAKGDQIRKKSSKPSSKPKKLELVSVNQMITKVKIWENLSVRGKKTMRYLGLSSPKKMAKSPMTWSALVIILALGIGFTYLHKKHVESAAILAADQQVIDQSVKNVDQLEAFLIVGRETDALLLVQNTEKNLATIVNQDKFSEQLSKMNASIDKAKSRLRKEKTIDSATVVISSLDSDLTSKPARLLLDSTGSLFVIPQNPKEVVKKTDTNITIQKLSTDITAWNTVSKRDDLLIFTTNDSVVSLNTKTQQSSTTNIQEQGPISSTSVFNNRVYSLVPGRNQITRSGLIPNIGSTTDWLTENGISLAYANDLAIDGSIYVLFPDKLEQFVLGKQAQPQIDLNPVEPKLSAAMRLALEANDPDLFILESNRVLHYKKTGSFVEQFIVKNKGPFVDMSVDFSKKTIYLLTDSEVLSITY